MKKIVIIVVVIVAIVLAVLGIKSCNDKKANTITLEAPTVEVK